MSRFITQDAAIIERVKSYRAASAVATLSKEQMDEDKQVVIGYMNDEGVEAMQAGNSYVVVTRYTSVRFDNVKFRKEHPELAKQYVTEVEAVRFTVKDA